MPPASLYSAPAFGPAGPPDAKVFRHRPNGTPWSGSNYEATPPRHTNGRAQSVSCGRPREAPDTLVETGIPLAQFAVDDVQAEYERMRDLGIRFTQEPLEMDPVTSGVFDDTCGT